MSKETVEYEAQETVSETKPLGGEERDFEAVLIDGCLGFSLSVGNAFILIIGAVWHVDYFSGGIIAVIAAAIAAIVFKLVQVFTDSISARSPRVFYVTCHALCFIIATIAMSLNLHIVSAIAAFLGLTDTIILYGRFLSVLARKALLLVVDAAFLYGGIMLMVLVNVPRPYSAIVLGAMIAVTIAVALLFIRRNYDFGELISAEDSRKRSIQVKGNRHTLFLIGFMLSGAILMRDLPFSMENTAMSLGLAFCAAGILSLVLRNINERGSKDTLRKSMSFVAVLFLVPLPFVPPIVQIILLTCYVCYVALNTTVLFDAIIETVRFNMIAAMWLLGKECSIFFMGLVAGNVVYTALPLLMSAINPIIALAIVCFVAVLVCAWLQIKVNYQIYPFEPIIEEKIDENISANIERSGKRKMVWHQKIDAACDQFHLSPREREILPILLRGRDAKYIMDTFVISQSTAKTHIYNIYRKFGIHSRQELLDFVEDIDLIDFVGSDDDLTEE